MSPTIRHKYKYFHSTVQRAKDRRQKFHFCRLKFDVRPRNVKLNREIKFYVTWSCVKRQTAKMTSEFVFFSSNPSLNHINIEKCLLLFATNTNIFTLLFKELKTDGQSFIFVVCRLTYDHGTWNLISLFSLLYWSMFSKTPALKDCSFSVSVACSTAFLADSCRK